MISLRYTAMVAYSDIAPFPKQMTIIVGLCVVGLMAFGLALSYYKNVLFDRQLLSMEQRNDTLRTSIEEQYGLLEYYRSARFRDKYAKENFGLLREGEKVLFLPTKNDLTVPVEFSERTDEEKQAIFEQNLRNIRIIDHWRMYVFHREEIENLRRQLLQ